MEKRVVGESKILSGNWNPAPPKEYTIQEIFEQCPKSEKTLIRHDCKAGSAPIKGYGYVARLVNDMGHPCEYRVIQIDTEKTLGMVKYYKGRLLSMYGIK